LAEIENTIFGIGTGEKEERNSQMDYQHSSYQQQQYYGFYQGQYYLQNYSNSTQYLSSYNNSQWSYQQYESLGRPKQDELYYEYKEK
jgi:hypothetical protein